MANNNFTSIDERLLIANRENKVAGDIRQDRMNQKRSHEERKVFDRRNIEVVGKTVSAVIDVSKKRSVLGAIKQAVLVGIMLRKEMDGYYMPAGVFISLIILASIKDALGMVTGGFFAPFAGVLIGMMIGFVLLGKRSLLSKMLKKFTIRIVLFSAAEMIPGLAILPFATLGIIWVKWDLDKKYKELKNDVENLEGNIEKTKNNVLRGRVAVENVDM